MLAQGYRGSRYSFGYPACPNLADQKQPLRPGDRVTLSERVGRAQSSHVVVGLRPAGRSVGLLAVRGLAGCNPGTAWAGVYNGESAMRSARAAASRRLS
jgi:hypothetical protein